MTDKLLLMKLKFTMALPWVSLLLIAAFMSVSIFSVVPSVLFDEWIYSNAATQNPASVPTASYLYTFLYSIVGLVAAPMHYQLGLALNIFFWMVQGVALYRLSRLALSRSESTYAVALVSLFSMSGWVYVFMPEVMFSALFFWGLYFLLAYTVEGRGQLALLASAVIVGLSSTVKVHSLFVLPGLLVLAFLATRARKFTLFQSTVMMAGYVMAVFLVKSIVSFLIAGPKGLAPLGQYQSAVDNFFFGLLGSEVSRSILTPISGPAGGTYLGVDAPTISVSSPSLSQLPGLLFGAFANFGFITLIAFAWLFLLPLLFQFKNLDGLVTDDWRLFGSVAIVFVNLAGLAIGFSVFATLSGDDHSNRTLFRYTEFIFILLAVYALVLMLRGTARPLTSRLYRARWMVPIAVIVVATFGSQASVRANYADSTFTPVLGQPFVWIPVVLVTLTSTLVLVRVSSQNLRRSLAWTVVATYSLVGIGTHIDIVTGANGDKLSGSKQAQYIQANLTETPFLISAAPQVSGRVATLAKMDQLEYGISLGTNPLSSEDLITDRPIIASQGAFFELDMTQARVVHTTEDFEHLEKTKDGSTLRENLDLDEVLTNSSLRYYSRGALYSSTGTETFQLKKRFSDGAQLEICFLLPEDISARKIEVRAGEYGVFIDVPYSASSSPHCVTLTAGKDMDTNEISIQSNVLTNELETGEVISQVAFGLSKLEIK